MSYILALKVNDETSKYNNEEFYFDLVTSKNINKGVNITTHPLVNGDLVGEHMYKESLTLDVSGTFSMNGNKPSNYSGSGDRLTNIQKLFEELMDNGSVLDVRTFKKEDKSVTRFLQRPNMVLERLRWTENQNTLDYTFTFRQIMFSNVDEAIPIVLNDKSLMGLTQAVPLSFSEEVFDKNQLKALIIKILYDSDIASKEFWNAYIARLNQVTSSTGEVIGAAIGAASLIGGIAIIGSAAAVAATGVGLPLVLIGAGIAVIALCIKGIVNDKKTTRKWLENKHLFESYSDPSAREAEFSNFDSLISKLMSAAKQALTYIKAYDITSDQNQELLTYIDNNYYVFEFVKNNTTAEVNKPLNIKSKDTPTAVFKEYENEVEDRGYYNVRVVKVDGENVSYGGKQTAIGSATIEEAKDRCLFTTKNGHYVYLMNKKITEIMANYSDVKQSLTPEEEIKQSIKRQEEIKKAQQDLSNFYIIDSQFDLREFEDRISAVLIETIGQYEE